MPYARNADLPKPVRDALPEEAQTVFRNVFNSASDRGARESSAFAQAWGALRRAGWRQGTEGSKWVKKAREENGFSASFEVKKADAEQGLVFGWASIAEEGGSLIFDDEDDGIEEAELEKGAYGFVRDARVASDSHDPSTVGVGVLVESMFFSKDKQALLGIDVPVGWWVGFHVEDPALRKSLREGSEHRMFSIGGVGKRTEVEV